MISSMHRQSVGLVTLLGLAFAAIARPALAQQAADGGWFDGESAGAPPPSVAPPGPLPRPQGAPPPQDPGLAPPAAPDDLPETDPRAMTEFRPTLDPYGTWVEDEKYGTVWVPNRDAVGDDFAPYVSAGHWALTDDGDWIWQSDYPFGGVVFHYGRWVWVPGTGWAWVAGRRYANAWVNWRVPTDDYGYIGWAPMPPAWGWYGGLAVSLWWYPPAPYVFCPSGYAFSYRVHSYIVHDPHVIHDVAAHTRNYSSGASPSHIAATPRALPANSTPPRGPTLQSAHVPPASAPASRVAGGSAFSGTRPSVPGAPSSNVYARSGSNYSAYRAPNAAPYQGARPYSSPSSYARSPSYQNPSGTMRSSSYGSSTGATGAASSAAPRYYSTPAVHYSTAPPHSSAPSVHYAAPSAPAYHYSAPAYHYSAPTRASSPAPAFHSHSRR